MAEVGGRFEVGSTAVQRDVLHGKISTAYPGRVVEDRDGLLALGRWPGVTGLSNKSWVDWLRTMDSSPRTHIIEELAAGTWELAEWTWRDTQRLDLLPPDAYFSVSLYFGADGKPPGWYVDFVLPYRRTEIGVDSLDLLLDLVIGPDLELRWKDEDEYDQGRRLGIISDAVHKEVQRAREQVIGLFEERIGPFEERWLAWRPDPAWPLPALPANALAVPTTVLQMDAGES